MSAGRIPRTIPRAKFFAVIALHSGNLDHAPYHVEVREYSYQGNDFRIAEILVETEASVRHWAKVFGTSENLDVYPVNDKIRHESKSWGTDEWPFKLTIVADIPAGTVDQQLDEAIREQLQQLVDEPVDVEPEVDNWPDDDEPGLLPGHYDEPRGVS